MTRWTVTLRYVIVDQTLSVDSTRNGTARIFAFSFEASEIVGTIVVLVAFTGHSASGFSVSIAHSVCWTHTSIRAGSVFALSGGVAQLFSALVNVSATERSSNKSFSAFTFGVQANLILWTIDIRSTPWFTDTCLVTDLAWQAIVVSVAYLGADIVGTSFADGTHGGVRTG